jgi:hypothetical protein
MLPHNASVWLRLVSRLGTRRRRIATVQRLLIHRAARLTNTASRHELRFAPAASDLIAQALAQIRAH